MKWTFLLAVCVCVATAVWSVGAVDPKRLRSARLRAEMARQDEADVANQKLGMQNDGISVSTEEVGRVKSALSSLDDTTLSGLQFDVDRDVNEVLLMANNDRAAAIEKWKESGLLKMAIELDVPPMSIYKGLQLHSFSRGRSLISLVGISGEGEIIKNELNKYDIDELQKWTTARLKEDKRSAVGRFFKPTTKDRALKMWIAYFIAQSYALVDLGEKRILDTIIDLTESYQTNIKFLDSTSREAKTLVSANGGKAHSFPDVAGPSFSNEAYLHEPFSNQAFSNEPPSYDDVVRPLGNEKGKRA